MPPFILASASPRRLALLKQVGYVPAEIIAPEIDETPRMAELPRLYVRRVAEAKALCVASQRQGSTVLAADTTIACGRRILGKPQDRVEAERFLRLLSGRRHRVHTALAMVTPDNRLRVRDVVTQVLMKRLSDREITLYLDSGEWQDKAGGYAIQGMAERFIVAVHGSYSNVVGLPLLETCHWLDNFAQLHENVIIPA